MPTLYVLYADYIYTPRILLCKSFSIVSVQYTHFSHSDFIFHMDEGSKVM